MDVLQPYEYKNHKEIKKLVWMYRETSTDEIAMIVACLFLCEKKTCAGRKLPKCPVF